MHCTSEPQVEAAIDVRKVLISHCKNHALTAHFQHFMYICMYVRINFACKERIFTQS